MALTAAQLLADQAYLFNDFPVETITIAGMNYDCLVPRAENRNDWEIGGLHDMPQATVLIDRNDLSMAPEQGGLATFRNETWRIATVRHDFLNAPIMIQLESARTEMSVTEMQGLLTGAGEQLLTGAGSPILKGGP